MKIASTTKLTDRGKGLSFEVRRINGDSDVLPAFAVRYNDEVYAYVNACGHIAVPLDYDQGNFFGAEGETLICSTHGAEYAPDSGRCLGGPCYGIGLTPLAVSEQDDVLYLQDKIYEVVNINV